MIEDLNILLLRSMMKIRIVEEMIAERYNEGKMRCPTHLSIGQEAVSAAVGLALRKDDFAVSTHRAHGHYLGKGGDLNRMIAEIYGKETGCSAGKGGSMHLIDTSVGFMGSTAIVGNTIPVGVGLGLSIRLNATDQVSCVFLGDGAIEEGSFYESVNFAVLKNLPVIFICENNFYSVYTPLIKRQPPGRKIHAMVREMGIDISFGDGNDILAVYNKLKEIITSMRTNPRPFFFELTTYRWREHCGPNFDNHIGYRSEEEFQLWKERDPIRIFQDKLISSSSLSTKVIDQLNLELTLEAQKAFEFAENSPYPHEREIFTHEYK
ncbi:MAG: thiamine pyrophosphate-dependent dehydrogenase E1 component subunit alpha [Leptospira sp.]|nr:thiamine pyrophosphate-dependent dehydrogenase E1 component subunit alpha [Leptospira sp.]